MNRDKDVVIAQQSAKIASLLTKNSYLQLTIDRYGKLLEKHGIDLNEAEGSSHG